MLSRKGVVATFLAAIVVLSGVPLGLSGSAVATTATVPAASQTITLDAEPLSVGSSANVSVGYNLTDSNDPANVSFFLVGDTGFADSNNSITTSTGTLNLTVPTRSVGGSQRVRVDAVNETSDLLATNTTLVTTDSPVTIDGYTVSTQTPAQGEPVTVNTTLNNTAGSSAEFKVNVYAEDFQVTPENNTTVTVPGNSKKHVELNVTYTAETTHNLTVNGQPPTEIVVGNAGGTGGESFTYTSVSAENTSVPLGQTGDVQVTYDLGDDIETNDAKLIVKNWSTTFDTNASLVDNDTVTMSIPEQTVAGPQRVTVAVQNTTDGTMYRSEVNLTVVGNTTVESVSPPATAVASAGTNVSVTLNNTGPTNELFQIPIYDSATSQNSVGYKWVTVPANTEQTYNVSTAYSAGTKTTYLANVSYGTTEVAPAATVESVTHLNGPENTSVLTADVRTGSLLTVELKNGTQQDLASAGVTESSVFEVVVHLNKSIDPGLVLANAHNVSWEITDTTTDYYEVTITAQPLESQFMRGAPSLDNWDSLSDSEDQADDKLLWYSISFIDEDSLYNQNMSGMTIATDAQVFGSPQYNQTTDAIEIDLAAPHYNTTGGTNDGIYNTTIPASLLSEWGVSNPSELAGTYQGQSRTLTTAENPDGSLDVSMDIHYSSGQVAIFAETDDSTTTDSETTSDSASSTDSTTSSSTNDDGDDDSSAITDDDANTARSTDEKVTKSVTGVESATVVSVDEETTVTLTNASSNETVTIDLKNVTDTTNETVVDDTRPNVSNLDLNLSTESSELAVSVSSHDVAPNGTPEYTNSESNDDAGESDAGVVGYLQIDVSGTTDEEIEDARITFTVPVDKLEASGTNPENVTLARYHDGEWQTLETRHLGGDRYAAVTPGFSVFAITTEYEAVGDQTSAAQSSEETTEQPDTVTETATATATKTTTSQPTTASSETTQSESPGFGITVALAALALVAARVWRN
ncbi:PGF-pre-PGF domain-containing protein [Haloferax sp. DFSO60]|uniref:PGF-pre-PGF domain-containing protein n=1 Tax=Haloferax sp. DFSO60 TaxID=3388652 RepID=UPI0039797322